MFHYLLLYVAKIHTQKHNSEAHLVSELHEFYQYLVN